MFNYDEAPDLNASPDAIALHRLRMGWAFLTMILVAGVTMCPGLLLASVGAMYVTQLAGELGAANVAQLTQFSQLMVAMTYPQLVLCFAGLVAVVVLLAMLIRFPRAQTAARSA